MPGHQIRFNDTLDDLGWMGEEAFVLRLFHRQKESRSFTPSPPLQNHSLRLSNPQSKTSSHLIRFFISPSIYICIYR